MLYIANTFDYEIFMGQNYVSEEEVLIKPTRKLCQMLCSEGVSSTFFADVLCPIQYRELGHDRFPNAFDTQLRELHQLGHDIQLHIHPHWLKTTKIGGVIEFDRKYYRIHNWIENDVDTTPIKALVRKGKSYLEQILTSIDASYNCIAFRAGGYCLQPEQLIAPILYEEGIKIDSSVCYGHKYTNDGMRYDYTNLPLIYNQYFSQKHGLQDGLQERPIGIESLFEVPVWGYKSFPHRAIASKMNKKISNAKPTGHGMSITPAAPLNTLARIKRIFTAYNMLTFDFFHSDSMVYMINQISKSSTCRKKDVFISIISHPKCQSDQHIDNMQRAIRQLKKNPKVRFVSMKQIAELKNL